MRNSRPLPFKLDRVHARSLTDQVYEGLRTGIRSGYWRVGQNLPTRAELVAALGVSKNVVQTAIARLVSDGLIVSRPKCGCLVQTGKTKQMLGRIIEVTPGLDAAYWHAAFSLSLQANLAKGGVSCVSVALPRGAGRQLDFSGLEYEVAKGVDLIVVSCGPGDRQTVWRKLKRLAVPFVWRGARARTMKSPLLVGFPTAGRDQAQADFIADCCRKHVQSVLLLSYEVASVRGLRTRFEKAGIYVEQVAFPASFLAQTLDELVLAARDLMTARLRQGPLCDLIYSADDYMTMGALAALNGAELRIPDDVSLVTQRNKGFGPVLDKSMARIESDPVGRSANLADSLLSWLKTGKFKPWVEETVYVPGATFPEKGRGVR